jgi:hypothetical protein
VASATASCSASGTALPDVGAHDRAGVEEPEVPGGVPDRRRFVGQPGGRAHRVGHAQGERAPPQVERGELLAEPVHRPPVERDRQHRVRAEPQRGRERQPVGLPHVLGGAGGDVPALAEQGDAEGPLPHPDGHAGTGQDEPVAGVEHLHRSRHRVDHQDPQVPHGGPGPEPHHGVVDDLDGELAAAGHAVGHREVRRQVGQAGLDPVGGPGEPAAGVRARGRLLGQREPQHRAVEAPPGELRDHPQDGDRAVIP